MAQAIKCGDVQMYKTTQGDTWDLISFRVYGSESFMDKLIKANPDHQDIVIFPAGIELITPVVDSQQSVNLPPWKRPKE